MHALFISGIFMSFFIVFLLLTKKNKALTDRILAAWVAVIGIHLLGFYLKVAGYWEIYPHLIGVTAPFPLLHGPFLYLYTLYSLRSDAKIRKVDFLHFVPFIAAFIYMSGFFFFYSPEKKLQVDRGEVLDYAVFTVVLLVAILISGLTYAVLSYWLTLKHERRIDNNFSYDEDINLNWLRYCILAIALVFLSAVIVVVLRDGFGLQFLFNAEYIIYSIIILFIFYIGYFGIRHQHIFINNSQIVPAKASQAVASGKYKNSGLRNELALEIHAGLLKLMEEEKPFLEPKLTLSALAQRLGVTPNQLSQVINQQEQVNFHDFVNHYRVEEFIRKAGQHPDYSFLALALDSGFNSKSSFNNIFKKHKGSTPSKYMTEHLSRKA
jgi:AraC-like DNA-binding protein